MELFLVSSPNRGRSNIPYGRVEKQAGAGLNVGQSRLPDYTNTTSSITSLMDDWPKYHNNVRHQIANSKFIVI